MAALRGFKLILAFTLATGLVIPASAGVHLGTISIGAGYGYYSGAYWPGYWAGYYPPPFWEAGPIPGSAPYYAPVYFAPRSTMAR